MMIGVAQVIGMKPTLRSFFSGVPRLGEGLGRGLEREELRDARRARSRRRPISGTPGARHPSETSRASPRTRRRPRNASSSDWRPARSAARARPDRVRPRSDAGRTRSPLATARGRHRRDRRRWTCPIPSRGANGAGKSRHVSGFTARPRERGRAMKKHAVSMPLFRSAWPRVGRPSSIGSDGSRDHSFQEPKYIRTSFTPAFFSARKVFDARAPLKQ